MNTDEQNALTAAVFDPPNEMLRKLVERQGLELKRVNKLNDELYAANAKLSGELLAASEERKKVLMMLQGEVASLRDANKTTVHQRDTVHRALSELVLAGEYVCETCMNSDRYRVWDKAYREADELLTVIDDLKTAAAKKK